MADSVWIILILVGLMLVVIEYELGPKRPRKNRRIRPAKRRKKCLLIWK